MKYIQEDVHLISLEAFGLRLRQSIVEDTKLALLPHIIEITNHLEFWA